MEKDIYDVHKQMKELQRREGVMDISAMSPGDMEKIEYNELLLRLLREIRRCMLFNDINGFMNEIRMLQVTTEPYVSEEMKEQIKAIDTKMERELANTNTLASLELRGVMQRMIISKNSLTKMEFILASMHKQHIFFGTDFFLLLLMMHYEDTIKSAKMDSISFFNEVLLLKALVSPFIIQKQFNNIEHDLDCVTSNFYYYANRGVRQKAYELIANFSYGLLRFLVKVMDTEGFLYERTQSINLALAKLPYEETQPVGNEEKQASYMLTGIWNRLNKHNQNWLCGLVGGTGCQPKGSKVLMADFKWKDIEKIKLGDVVLSPQENGTFIRAKVIKLYKWFSKKTYNVFSYEKKLYSCSFNHEIPLIVDKKYCNLKAQHLEQRHCYHSFDYNFNDIPIHLVKDVGKEVYGFTLDSPSHWYITNDGMVTKNSGKSYSALWLAKKLDPTFDASRVAFSFKEFMEVFRRPEMTSGKFILWDESGVDLDSRKFYSSVNILANRILQTFRNKNIGVIFTVPDPTFLDRRSRILFHNLIETKTILRDRELVVTDWRESKKTISSDEIFQWRPRMMFSGQRFKICNILVPKPDRELTKEYEKRKTAFTTALNKDIYDQLSETKEIIPKSAENLRKIATEIITEGVGVYSQIRGGKYVFSGDMLELKYSLKKSDAKKLKWILEENMNHDVELKGADMD